MATHDYVIDNSTGANVRTDLNNVLQAILSNNSSSSAPSTTAAYMWWADTNTGILKIRNSANNAWVELLQLDGTLTLEDGSASTPALAFRDDLNTGIFSSAADTFNVATGGVERMELGTTTIFNEDGADVDFRIEGDTNANLFYVDAGNSRIGIGTSSPNAELEVFHATDPEIHLSINTHGDAGTLLGDADGLTIDGRGNSNQLRFKVGGSHAMRLDSSGRLLIATTSASAADSSADDLVIGNTSQGNNGMTLVTGNANNGAFFFADQDGTVRGGIRYQHGADVSQFYAGGDVVLNLKNKGVGINESSPTADALTIRGGDTNDTPLLILRCHTDGATTTGEVLGKIQFVSNEDNVDSGNPHPRVALHAVQVNNAGAAKLEFYTVPNFTTDAVKTMTLNQEGRLCIGTDDAVAKLNVVHSSSDTTATGSGTLANCISVSNTNSAINNFAGIVFGDRTDSQDFIGGIFIRIHDHSQNYGDLHFYTNGSGGRTEKLRIDSSGRMMLGTTIPIGKYTVKAANSSGSAAYGVTNSGKASEGIDLNCTTVGDGNFGGAISFGCGGNGRSGIAAVQTGSDDDRNGLVFLVHGSTTGTDNAHECARFMADGFLKAKGNAASYQNAAVGYHELVGDTAHDVVAKIQHKSSTGYGLQMLMNHANSSIYALAVRDYSSGNNDKAFIRADGDLENANNSYGGISDVKLKENIVDAKSQWDDIKALKVRNFNFKIDESKTKLLGLVAQEAEAVCPSLVKTHPDLGENNEDLGTETKVLKYSIVYMKAIKALQEAQTRIETLETKVAALESA